MQTLAKKTTISAQISRPNGNIKIGGRGVGDALIAGDVIEGSFFRKRRLFNNLLFSVHEGCARV